MMSDKAKKADQQYSIYSPHWTGLSKMIEEAGEVIQVGAKIITAGGGVDWDGSDLTNRLQDELGDLMATIDFFLDTNPQVDYADIMDRRAKKLDKFRRHGYPSNNHYDVIKAKR